MEQTEQIAWCAHVGEEEHNTYNQRHEDECIVKDEKTDNHQGCDPKGKWRAEG